MTAKAENHVHDKTLLRIRETLERISCQLAFIDAATLLLASHYKNNIPVDAKKRLSDGQHDAYSKIMTAYDSILAGADRIHAECNKTLDS